MADKDYYSFEEVLKDLAMEEDELKRLVSAGEIRAFRDKQTMRFKAEDVERLKEPGDDDADELVLDDDLELDLGGDDLELADDALMPELDEGGDELLLEDAGDELGDLEELDLGGDPGGGVEEIDLGGGDVEEIDLGADDGGLEELDLGADEPAERMPRAKRKVGAGAAVEEEVATEGAGTLALLTVGAVVLILVSFVMFSAVAGHSNPTNQWLMNLFS